MSSQSASTEDLLQLLEKANLLSYKEALLEQGADDIEQLLELEDEEFEQLCIMVGMDKKPFHVMRLKKALNRHTSKPRPSPAANKSTPTLGPSPSSSALVVDSPKLPSAKSSTESVKSNLQTPSRSKSCDSSNNSSTSSSSSKTLYLPPYLQDNSDSRNFDELIDNQTPVQKTLGPCPFIPSMWDSERKDLIRKYASIYGKNFNRRQKEILTPFEEQVNEGAFQLCLRDPTLLVRREELFVLAKRAVKEGGYTYYHGFSKGKDSDNTIATTGQKRVRLGEESSSSAAHLLTPSAKVLNITGNLTDDMPKKLSGRMRQEKMIELERLIASNKAQQAAKLVELEQAQQLCNFSAAFSIQLEVESLGNACQLLQTSYTNLKRKQRRSDRYYNSKEREQQGIKDPVKRSKLSTPPTSPVLNSDGSELEIDGISGITRRLSDDEREKIMPSSKMGGNATKRSTVTATIIPSTTGATGTVTAGQTLSSSTPAGIDLATRGEDDSGDADDEVVDLVKNVSHATDEVNSLMIREFQKQLVWDM